MSRPLSSTEVVSALEAAGIRVEGTDPGVSIRGASHDSRSVRKGDLFLAWKGHQSDGHAYLGDAATAGAVAALVERPVPGVSIPQLVVDDGRLAAAVAADALNGSPWKSLRMTAVTGTNGKTTTTMLVRWLSSGREPSASIGTLGLTEVDGSIREGTENLTTPGPVQVAEWLADLHEGGATAVAMEASSHALAQSRLDGMRFDVAVFTNVSQDHLDYHGDMTSYVKAKRRLAKLLKRSGVVVANADVRAWDGLVGPGGRLAFGTGPDADLRASEIVVGSTGTRFTLSWGEQRRAVALPLVGAFNVENALAAAAALLALGADLPTVVGRLEDAPQVPGRLERIPDLPFSVLIDFAHTPDALRRVLQVLRPLSGGRLIVVFGAGGDRDRGKRPLMGRAAAENADVVIVTSDNPRTEDPESIIDEIVPGLGDHPYVREADRRLAVRLALEEADAGDMVLLAGKGHETYQVIGTVKTPFDEREIVRSWLDGRAA